MTDQKRLGRATQSFVLLAVIGTAFDGAAFAQTPAPAPGTPGTDAAPAAGAPAAPTPVPDAPAVVAAPPAPVVPPPPPPPAPAAAPAPASPLTYVGAKFSATLYGFIEADNIWDSTQSYNDLPGNGQIARSGTYAGDHGRTFFAARNSRIGFRLKGPETPTIKSSAQAEMDFLGNQPQGNPAPTGTPPVSEAAFFTNPTFRIRH